MSRLIALSLLVLTLAACTDDPSCEGSACGCSLGECPDAEERPEVRFTSPRFRLVRVTPGATGLVRSVATAVNDEGVLTGHASTSSGTVALRFSEGGGLEVLDGGGSTLYGLAINGSGAIAGFGLWRLGSTEPHEEAVFIDGASIERIGESSPRQSVGNAINDAGQVAGTCLTGSGQEICRWDAATGWTFLGPGRGTGLADDGSIVGATSRVASSAVLVRDGALVPLGPDRAFGSVAVGISRSGRRALGDHRVPRVGDAESSVPVLYDLHGGSAPLQLDDADGHPLRPSASHPFAVNDEGFTVGTSMDASGRQAGWLRDPFTGETHLLEKLVDNLDGALVLEARGLSNAGHVAATAVFPGRAPEAVLLVPTRWPSSSRPPVTVADELRTDLVLLPDDDGAGTAPLGLAASGAIGVVAGRRESGEPKLLPGLVQETGTTTLEVGGLSSWPVRISAGGRLVGTGTIVDELLEITRYVPFVQEGDAFLPTSTPPGMLAVFGLDADDEGRVLAECVGEDGVVSAWVRDPAGEWSKVFEGRPHALVPGGGVVGADAQDAVLVRDGEVRHLGLGAGAEARAVSEDGRFVAGIHGHAFVWDSKLERFDWLPDAFGDPASHGRMEPAAVNGSGVVVGTGWGVGLEPFAFRYDASSGRLVRLTAPPSLGVVLRRAVDVDEAGNVLVEAVEPDGTPRTVLVPALP